MSFDSQMYFCVLCDERFFFKNDLKQHFIKSHSNARQLTERFQQLIDGLIDYCSQLETTFPRSSKKSSKKKKKRQQKRLCLPEDNVKELLDSCPLCQQMIAYYGLESFDRSDKPLKDVCICGNTDPNNGLKLINCIQCQHYYHFECIESENYSGQDLSQNLCRFCAKYEFTINCPQDMKPLEQLRHFRQHLHYNPIKCDVSSYCGEHFYFHPIFVDHLKESHQMSDELINDSTLSHFITENIPEIEALLQLIGIKSEINLRQQSIGETIETEIKPKTKTPVKSAKPNIKAEPISPPLRPSTSKSTTDSVVDQICSMVSNTGDIASSSREPLIVSSVSVPDSRFITPEVATQPELRLKEGQNYSLNNNTSDNDLQQLPQEVSQEDTAEDTREDTSDELLQDLPKEMVLKIKEIANSPIPKVGTIEDFYTEAVITLTLELETKFAKLIETKETQIYSYLSSKLPFSEQELMSYVNQLLMNCFVIKSKECVKEYEKLVLQLTNDLNCYETQNSNEIQSLDTKRTNIYGLIDQLSTLWDQSIQFKIKLGLRSGLQDMDLLVNNFIQTELITHFTKELTNKYFNKNENTFETNVWKKLKEIIFKSENNTKPTETALNCHKLDLNPNEGLISNPILIPSTSSQMNVVVQSETSSAGVNQKSNYSIPKIKLPNDLSPDLAEDIKRFIEENNGKNSICDSNRFDLSLKRIEKECRKLCPSDRDKVRSYLMSNLSLIKEVLTEKCTEFAIDLVESDRNFAFDSLTQYVNQIAPQVLDNFKMSVENVKNSTKNNTQSHIQPHGVVPVKVFKWTESIKKSFNDLISYYIEYYEMLFRNDPGMKLNTYLYEVLEGQVLPIWPKTWMTIDVLKQKAKVIMKLKSPQKTTELSRNPIPVVTNELMSALTNTANTSTDSLISMTTTTVCPNISETNGLKTPKVSETQTTCAQTFDFHFSKPFLWKTKTSHEVNTNCDSDEPLVKRKRLQTPSTPLPDKPMATSTPKTTTISKTRSKDTEQEFDYSNPIPSTSTAQTPNQLTTSTLKLNLNALDPKPSSIKTSEPTAQHEMTTNDEFEVWITQTKNLKFPYFPQIEDKVVYLRAGHNNYFNALREKGLINSLRNSAKCHKYSKNEFKNFETIFAIIKDISFEDKPFRSVKLRLEEVDPQTNRPNNQFFNISYYKMSNVSDFLLLRQTYDKSLTDDFKAGDSFATLSVDEFWKYGVIVNESSFCDAFPTSLFNRLEVSLNDESFIRLSAWDLEPTYRHLNVNESPVVNEIDLESSGFYRPNDDEWPEGMIEGASDWTASAKQAMVCKKLKSAFDEIMATNEGRLLTSAANLFSERKPIYPIDLTTIGKRLQNGFYRRSAQIKWDFKMIATNVEMFLDSEDIRNDCKKIIKVCVDFMEDFWGDSSALDLYCQQFGHKKMTIDNEIEILESDEEIPNHFETNSQTEEKTYDKNEDVLNESLDLVDDIDDEEPIDLDIDLNRHKYLCVFCWEGERIVFEDKRVAKSHLKQHLAIGIKCEICFANYHNWIAFLNHNTKHSEDTKNLMVIKNYFLTEDWIHWFLDFQLSPEFTNMTISEQPICCVCRAIQMKGQVFRGSSHSHTNESFEDHIRKHLNYSEVYECLKCNETQNQSQKYKFYFNSIEAKKHLSSHSHELQMNFENISENDFKTYFRVNEMKIPNIEAIVERFVGFLNLYQSYYESMNCFD